jgi:hypothetical protein
MALDRRRLGSESQAIAFHEAGHAVMACHYGRSIRSVAVDFRNGWGLTETSTPGEMTAAEIWHEVMILFAGGEAEYRFAPYRRDLSPGSRFDCGRAFRLIRSSLESQPSLTLDRRWIELEAESTGRRLMRQAADLIGQPPLWRAVKAAAEILLQEGKVAGGRAEAVIHRALGPC